MPQQQSTESVLQQLQRITQYGSSTAFQALVNEVSGDEISSALICEDKGGPTVLEGAIRYQSSAVFQTLVEKANSDAVSQALLKGSDDSATLRIAAMYQSSAAFQALVEKASDDAISKALTPTHKNGLTVLEIVAKYQSSDAFQALVDKASINAIDQALTRKGSYHSLTVLEIVAKYQSSTAFETLTEKASGNATHQALTLMNDHYNLRLQTIDRYQASAVSQVLTTKANASNNNRAEALKKDDNWKRLNAAASGESSVVFQRLVNAASDDAINQALIHYCPYDHSNTYYNGRVYHVKALQAAVRHQSSDAFQTLVAKASSDAISRALTRKFSGPTALQTAARRQSSDAFQALVNKASVDAVSYALTHDEHMSSPVLVQLLRRLFRLTRLIQDDYFCLSTLHIAAMHKSPDSFLALVDKASVNAINCALNFISLEGRTALETVALYQAVDSFQALITKASNAAIHKALTRKGNYLLETLLTSQPAENIMQLFSKLTRQQLINVFKNSRLSEIAIDNLLEIFLHNDTYDNKLSTETVFSLLQASKAFHYQMSESIHTDLNTATFQEKQSDALYEFLFTHSTERNIAALMSLDSHWVPSRCSILAQLDCMDGSGNRLRKGFFTRLQPATEVKELKIFLEKNCQENFLESDDLSKIVTNYFNKPLFKGNNEPVHNLMTSLLPFVQLQENTSKGICNYKNSLCSKGKDTIYNAMGSKIELTQANDNTVSDMIREQGLCSWRDFYKLRALKSKTIDSTLNELLEQKKLFRCSENYNTELEQAAQTRLLAVKKKIADKKEWRIHGLLGGTKYNGQLMTKTASGVLKKIRCAEQNANSSRHNETMWYKTQQQVAKSLASATSPKALRDNDTIAFNRQLLSGLC